LSQDKRNNLKETGKELALETVLNVGTKAAGDAAKSSITSIVGDLLVDTASSLVPGVSGAVQGYKRARFESNITTFTGELHTRIEEIRVNLEEKTDEQKEKIDQLFNYVMDYVIDEQQEEKIHYMVNGFVTITEHKEISDDFVLTYYDVLKELRMVDISVLRLMYSSRYIFDQETRETFQDVMERHGISYEQYESVRRNLLRIGLLTTKTDLNITDDLEEIVKKFKDLYAYLDKLTDPKFKRSLPTLKMPKLKSKENFELSKFGRDFVKFFVGVDKE
jgi:hemerythrin